MELHNDGSPIYQPVLLLRNVSYPTFQLHAFAGGRSAPPETVLKIVILETMQWLRQRFRAFELPTELDMPEPARYSEVELTQLTSFHLDMGYKLEVMWLPEHKSWALQLTEPDLGTRPGTANQERMPVPGRLFETNIAYRAIPDGVECGFNTVVSEPAGTEAVCEVFRLAFIKNLARNPLVGLRQTWQLIDEAHRISDMSDIKKLRVWLTAADRMMPAVVMTEWVPEIPPADLLPLPKDSPALFNMDKPCLQKLSANSPPQPTVPSLPLDISGMTRYRMGYAQFFVLPASLREKFNNTTRQKIGNGEIFIFEPDAFGGRVTRYKYDRIKRDPDAVREELDCFIQNYLKGKTMTFGDSVFVPQAKNLERERIMELHQSVEDMMNFYNDKLRLAEDRHRRELADSRKELAAKDEKIARLNRKIDEADTDKATLRDALAQAEIDFHRKLDDKDQEILRCQALLDSPKKPYEVIAWAERYLGGRLFLHDRAKGILQKIQPDKVNLPLLCDALEYLGTEYRDELLGLIDAAERDERCSAKYHRPFEVVPTRGLSVDMYPTDYKIKYYTGYKGKPVESTLDLHLRVGNDADNLLRIYFLYDSEKKRIVVGSLPEHLRTASYK